MRKIRSVVPSLIPLALAAAALRRRAGPSGDGGRLPRAVREAMRFRRSSSPRPSVPNPCRTSVSASPRLTTEQLESKGVEQFFDYGNSVPNLSFAVGAADGSLAARGVALRGIQGANTTGFYIDDTPVLETLDPHIVDVARIEVLRGPQGTLYGAESMGGTVRIITAQPNATRFQRTSARRDFRHRPRLLERDRGRRRQPAAHQQCALAAGERLLPVRQRIFSTRAWVPRTPRPRRSP